MQNFSVAYIPKAVPYTRTGSQDLLIAIFFKSDNYVGHDIESFVAKNSEVFLRLFEEISNCYNEKKAGYQYRCTAILNKIFEECYKQFSPQTQGHSQIQKSIDFIHKNFKNSNINIKDIASLSYLSDVQFRKHFEKELGVSPKKYIINLRIEHAVNLMLDGFYSLQEIAFMCGYTDYKYFSSSFKKMKGISPSEYQRKTISSLLI